MMHGPIDLISLGVVNVMPIPAMVGSISKTTLNAIGGS